MEYSEKQAILDRFRELCPNLGDNMTIGYGAFLEYDFIQNYDPIEMVTTGDYVYVISIRSTISSERNWSCIFYQIGENEVPEDDAKWHLAKLFLPPVQQSTTELREQVVAECRRLLGENEEAVLPDGATLTFMAFKPGIDRFRFDVPDSYPMLNTKRFCDFMIYDSDQWEQTAKLKMAKTLLGI